MSVSVTVTLYHVKFVFPELSFIETLIIYELATKFVIFFNQPVEFISKVLVQFPK